MKLVERPFRVALIIPPTFLTQAEVQRGILKYAREHGPWRIQLVQGRDDELACPPNKLKEFDGIFLSAYSMSASILAAIESARIPTVTMDAEPDLPSLVASIQCDNASIGRSAAEWLIERGFGNFAFVGSLQPSQWSRGRQETFAKRLSLAGRDCSIFVSGQHFGRLASWLTALPKPVAVLAANDLVGHQILNACEDAKLDVPREVAILAVDNNEELCENLTPPLSSIQMTTENAGYEAARFLDRTMRHSRRKRQKPKRFYYAFFHVVERQTSARMQHFDPIVERAMNFIRLNLAQPFRIDDLADKLHLSKRMLEMKFNRSTGHSPCAELIRQRVEKARMLIANTNKSLCSIAEECGFASASHLSRSFQNVLQATPGSFRN